MATKKISELPSGAVLQETDYIIVNQGGVTKKFSISKLMDLSDTYFMTEDEVDDKLDGLGGSNDNVKISINDTSTGFLEDKITAGSNVTIAKQSSGANESLQISATGGGTTTETLIISSVGVSKII